MRQWEILARHKWVSGATITESCKIEDATYRRFTATIKGWRNIKIFEGKIEFGIAGMVQAKVLEIRQRMDNNRVCKRCRNKVEKSELEEYSYSCNDCDEDLYSFETEIINTNEMFISS